MRKLGKVQQEVLDDLRRHGSWHPRCGWRWGTLSHTLRILDSLVRAGFATAAPNPTGGVIYRPYNQTMKVTK